MEGRAMKLWNSDGTPTEEYRENMRGHGFTWVSAHFRMGHHVRGHWRIVHAWAIAKNEQEELGQMMSFEEFGKTFKALYLEEKKRQELKGVVSIHGLKLCDKFAEQNSISEKRLESLYTLLKESGKIIAVVERGNELIHWME
jgi:hypothetical protein